jgi:hypothetical protein
LFGPKLPRSTPAGPSPSRRRVRPNGANSSHPAERWKQKRRPLLSVPCGACAPAPSRTRGMRRTIHRSHRIASRRTPQAGPTPHLTPAKCALADRGVPGQRDGVDLHWLSPRNQRSAPSPTKSPRIRGQALPRKEMPGAPMAAHSERTLDQGSRTPRPTSQTTRGGVLEVVLLRVSGGTGAGGDALRRWGRSNSGGGYLDSVLPETTCLPGCRDGRSRTPPSPSTSSPRRVGADASHVSGEISARTRRSRRASS